MRGMIEGGGGMSGAGGGECVERLIVEACVRTRVVCVCAGRWGGVGGGSGGEAGEAWGACDAVCGMVVVCVCGC